MPRANKKRKYEDALSALTAALSDREKDLEAREEQLRKDREELDSDRLAAYGDTRPSDVLHLNVGGVKTTVLRSTLTSIPGSMLASKFSGRWDDSIAKDENGHFFIDQEYSLFRHVIKYLRNKANCDEKYPMDSPDLTNEAGTVYPDTNKDFYRMIEYFGLTDGMYPVEVRGYPDGKSGSSSRRVDADDWETYALHPVGHKRRIQSYEVTLGTVQRIQIGWHACILEKKLAIQENDNVGVGDVKDTLALDLTRSAFLVDGKPIPVKGLGHVEGTVVRTEDFGKRWFVNGHPAAEFPQQKWDELCHSIRCRTGNGNYHSRAKIEMHPFISVKGEIEVTTIEFED
jgi:hypothetical protein